jgi:hypothetical protein
MFLTHNCQNEFIIINVCWRFYAEIAAAGSKEETNRLVIFVKSPVSLTIALAITSNSDDNEVNAMVLSWGSEALDQRSRSFPTVGLMPSIGGVLTGSQNTVLQSTKRIKQLVPTRAR